MRRARSNVETIYARLKAARYRFDQPERAWVPAIPADADDVRTIEAKAGPLPLSLRAWYEIVGSVCWTSSDPVWREADPLVIAPVRSIRDWCENEYEDAAEPFAMELSGDRFHKSGFSGGSYSISCGSPCADALIEGYFPLSLFVPYLRVCFRNGGFAGCQDPEVGDEALLRSLATGLLEI